MVVGIHTLLNCNFASTMGVCNVVIRQILNCAVPIFLAISGYFMADKILNTKECRCEFWKKQILKVWVPCIIWSLPLFLLSLKSGDNIIKSIVFLFVGGFSIYYFIALIIQYYLLLPYINSIIEKKGWNIVLIVSGLMSLISIVFISYVNTISLPLVVYAGPFWVWIIFFVLGVYLRKSNRDYSIVVLLILSLVSLGLQVLESRFLFDIKNSGFGIKPSSFLFSALMILVLFSKKIEKLYRENWFTKCIEKIGIISFTIYLSHCYVIMVLDIFLSIDIWIVKWGIVCVIDILLVLIARKIVPMKLYKYLGL